MIRFAQKPVLIRLNKNVYHKTGYPEIRRSFQKMMEFALYKVSNRHEKLNQKRKKTHPNSTNTVIQTNSQFNCTKFYFPLVITASIDILHRSLFFTIPNSINHTRKSQPSSKIKKKFMCAKNENIHVENYTCRIHTHTHIFALKKNIKITHGTQLQWTFKTIFFNYILFIIFFMVKVSP